MVDLQVNDHQLSVHHIRRIAAKKRANSSNSSIVVHNLHRAVRDSRAHSAFGS